eukprot:s2393_g8.t1
MSRQQSVAYALVFSYFCYFCLATELVCKGLEVTMFLAVFAFYALPTGVKLVCMRVHACRECSVRLRQLRRRREMLEWPRWRRCELVLSVPAAVAKASPVVAVPAPHAAAAAASTEAGRTTGTTATVSSESQIFEYIFLLQLQVSPRKRVLKPQRISAPVGGLLSSSVATMDDSTMHIAVYLLTRAACLLSERFSEDDHGYGIGWQCSNRRHQVQWKEFLTKEGLNDETLLSSFGIYHKVGPAPTYTRTLLCSGDNLENGLSLWENFHLWRFEHGQTKPPSIFLHNRSDQDLSEWVGGCSLELTMDTLPCPQVPWNSLGVVERRALLTVRQDGDQLQLTLSGHTWPWRSILQDWSGSWVTKDMVPTEKCQGSSYIRFSPPFGLSALQAWLNGLQDTCMEVALENVKDDAVLATISGTPWLHVR